MDGSEYLPEPVVPGEDGMFIVKRSSMTNGLFESLTSFEGTTV
jgi:hypothetical protein